MQLVNRLSFLCGFVLVFIFCERDDLDVGHGRCKWQLRRNLRESLQRYTYVYEEALRCIR
jgi:hypothetical protein